MHTVCHSFFRVRSAGHALFACLLVSVLALGASSCSDGGTGGASLTALSVGGSQSLDTGQSTTVTATITNDGTPGGATFTVTGGGTLGTATTAASGQTKKISIPYTAPAMATTATVTATSVASPSLSYPVVITVTAAPVITTTSLASGVVGTAYSATPVVTGGAGTLKWSITSGTLPAGITLNAASGVLSGTPTAAVSSTFTLAVTDSATTPVTAVQTLTLTVASAPPTVTPVTLASGVTGTAYSQQLAYTGGGTGTVVWSITSGSLPSGSGLTFSSAGLIAGTPAVAGSYTFAVAVTVGGQTSASVSFTLNVVTPVVVTTTTLPTGNINVAYSQQLAYSGGVSGSSVTWSIVSGSLPSTITLSSSGLLSGTPTTVASYTLGVAVTVGTQTSATQTLTLSVVSTQITSANSATGEVDLPFDFLVTAVGGTTPYTFSIASTGSALPAGLSINASTGAISGVPTSNTGSPYANVVVQATDSLGATGTQAMTFTVNPSRGSAGDSELNGQYAFELTGFDVSGLPATTVGSFTADGNGHITAGTADSNGSALASASTNVALTASTFAVGSDGRGQVTLASSAGSSSYVLTTSGLSNGVATGGSLLEFDATGVRLAGRFYKQTSGAFTQASLANGFAFGLSGWSANSSAAARTKSGLVGELQLSAAGVVSSSEFVTSASATPVTSTAGAFTVGSNGRGTLTLTTATGSLHFVVYVVSASQLVLLSTDAASGSSAQALLSGDALVQTITNGNFTAASLGASSVYSETKLGVTSTPSYFPDVQIGLLTFDGAGSITGTSDRSASGVVAQVALTGTYSVVPNGRASIILAPAGLSGCTNCTGTSYVFYFAGAGQGFYLDYAVSGGQGVLEPQLSGTTLSLSGAYALGTQAPATTQVVTESGLATVSSSSLVTSLDQSITGTTVPDVSTTYTATGATNGRVALTGISSGVLYIVSPSRALWLDGSQSLPVVRELTLQ